MREVALEAIERARRGEGPTLIEAQTYRFRGHSLADPDELREKKEKEHWQVQSNKTTNIPLDFVAVLWIPKPRNQSAMHLMLSKSQ